MRDLCFESSLKGDAERCKKRFTCVIDIMVLSGLEPACEVCAPRIPELRKLGGWFSVGRYFNSTNLTTTQTAMLANRITGANDEV